MKTLEDIKFKVPRNKTENRLGNRYIKDELREVTKEWIKYYEKEAERHKDNELAFEHIHAAKWWIKHFFNLNLENNK